MIKHIRFTDAKWRRPNEFRIQHLPPSAFLDPKEKKFPIKKSKDGPIYVHALRTARAYAVKYGYKEVARRAKKLLDAYDELKKMEGRK